MPVMRRQNEVCHESGKWQDHWKVPKSRLPLVLEDALEDVIDSRHIYGIATWLCGIPRGEQSPIVHTERDSPST